MVVGADMGGEGVRWLRWFEIVGYCWRCVDIGWDCEMVGDDGDMMRTLCDIV